jgi:hypothetical protein
MLRQVEALTTAIDLIRQPRDDFEGSLSQEQRSRLTAEAGTAASARDVKTDTRSCGSSAAAVDRSVAQVDTMRGECVAKLVFHR